MVNKYKAIKTERQLAYGVHVFDSKKEAQRFDELMLLLKAGQIRNLKLQPQFTLQESYVSSDGERIRAIRYTADFSYERRTKLDAEGVIFWPKVVEDCKSSATKTKDFEIRKRLLNDRFGISITEV